MLFRTAGEIVQVATHRPQKILGTGETLELVFGEHLELDELGDILDAVDVFRQPIERVQVPEPAFAFP